MTLGRRVRERAELVTFDMAIRGYAGLVRLLPDAQPQTHGVEVIHDVAYAPGPGPRRLDVYTKGSSGLRAPLLYFHGGGFARLSRRIYWLVALTLARYGFTVFIVDHRCAPVHRYPAAHEDAALAALWVRDNAARFGADPSRLLLAGDSTGANLVTALAVAASYRSSEPWARAVFEAGVSFRAAAAACGFLEVSDVSRYADRDELPKWIKAAIAAVGRDYCSNVPRATLVDPLVVLERAAAPERPLPPFFAAVGDRDPLADDTRRLARAVVRVGASCELREYEGGTHGFHYLFPWQKRSLRCWADHHRFLRRHARAFA